MENSIFRIGDKVYHFKYGWGEVRIIDTEDHYPAIVTFQDNKKEGFTLDGRYILDETPTLSFSEYKIEVNHVRPESPEDIIKVTGEDGEACICKRSVIEGDESRYKVELITDLEVLKYFK